MVYWRRKRNLICTLKCVRGVVVGELFGGKPLDGMLLLQFSGAAAAAAAKPVEC